MALGKFIHRYSKLEGIVHIALRSATGMSFMAAKVLLGNMRTSDEVSAIKRLSKLRNDPQNILDPLNRAFEQLTNIDKLRDQLVHRGISIRDGNLVCDNSITSKRHDLIEYFVITVEDLHKASDDLDFIGQIILHYASPTHHEHYSRMAQKLPGFDREFQQRLTEPWQYRPVLLQTLRPLENRDKSKK